MQPCSCQGRPHTDNTDILLSYPIQRRPRSCTCHAEDVIIRSSEEQAIATTPHNKQNQLAGVPKERTWYMPTSKGLCVSVSISNLTSGDASCSAPAADRLARSFLARRFMWRKPSRGTSSVEGSSHRRQHTMPTEEQSTQHDDECVSSKSINAPKTTERHFHA